MANAEQRWEMAQRAAPAAHADGHQRAARTKLARGKAQVVAAASSHAEKGKWSQALYEEYRAAKAGPRKRQLLSELININEPLARLLVDQLCGRGDGSRKRGFSGMSGCSMFRALPFEDAMQAGRVALQKALEQFDPSKRLDKHGNPNPYKPGEEYRISGYLKSKLRHELQRLYYYGQQTVRTPRPTGKTSVEEIAVALVGDEQTLDLLSGGAEDEALARLQAARDLSAAGVSREDVERWEETGELSEAALRYQAKMRGEAEAVAQRTEVASAMIPPRRLQSLPAMPTTLAGMFAETSLVFRRSARETRIAIVSCYERFAEQRGVHACGRELRGVLVERGAAPQLVRLPWSDAAEAGFRGVELRAAG